MKDMKTSAAARRVGQQQGRTRFGQRGVEHDLGLYSRNAVDIEPMLALEILHGNRQFLIVDIVGVPDPRRRPSGH